MIFVDTNVVSEAMKSMPDQNVSNWLAASDSVLALSTIVIGEISFGIEKVRLEQRSLRYETGLAQWRKRFAGRIFGFDEESALHYGVLMGKAKRSGIVISAPDGMIAAIALRHHARLATRNVKDFTSTFVDIINPWKFTA